MICNEFISLAHVLPFCHLSEEDFDLALYEQQNGAIRFDLDRLENLKFNPLISETNNQFSLCSDNDPDSNFYSSFSCNYYIEDTFNELIDVETEKHLSILHLNTRSLPRNFDKVTNLLSTLNLNFSMIGISETWLKDASHSCDIPGYNYIHEPRRSRTGGGVGLYLNQDFQFKCRPEICFSDSCAESLFVQIIR